MENLIEVKNEYNSLNALQTYLNMSSEFDCSKEYDIWDHRVDSKGQMEQCLVLKKSSMHAVKMHFVKDNTLKVNYVIPNKVMHAYFGKSQKRYRNIIEIATGAIKNAVLKGPQQKAFNELEAVVKKAS